MPKSRYFLSDFVSIQRQSFFTLLEKGLIEEWNKRNPITNGKISIFFYPEYYILTRPVYNPQEAILKKKSYTSQLLIPVQITNRNRKKILLKWVSIGNIPLMTKRGHFILNGAARVIVSQILRSPGIYYQEKIYSPLSKKRVGRPEDQYKRYYADIICMRGTWLRLLMDKEKNIWAQMKKGPKIPIYWFLLAMGITEKTIFKSITESYRLLGNLGIEEDENKPLYSYLKNSSSALKEIYTLIQQKTKGYDSRLAVQKRANEGTRNLTLLGRKWFYNRFMNPRSYDLGKNGRLALNKKLGLTIASSQLTLTGLDVLYATDYLIKVEKGQYKIDDIDHLKNRRVRTSGELIQMQIGVGLVRLETQIRSGLLQLSTEKSFLQPVKGNKRSVGGNRKSRSDLDVSGLGRGVAPTPNKEKVSPIIGPSSYASLKPKRLGGKKKTQHLSWPLNRERKSSLADPPTGRQALRALHHLYRPKKKRTKVSFIGSPYYSLFNNKPFNSAIREFFGTSPLSQFMDQMNPLAELTHKRRLSSMGPGGVTRDSATLAIRGIHPTHYGRICPIETPEGKNTGLVSSMTAYARVNENGIIESPVYSVYKGLVQKNTGMYFFSAEQEEKIQLAAADLFISPIGFLPPSKIPVRSREEFTKTSRQLVSFINVSPLQIISIATSLIPFLEHDDANRALMGSNMQRQAVPLIRPSRPIVGTGLEARAVSDSGHVIQSQMSGLVTYASANKIVVYHFSLPTSPVFPFPLFSTVRG